MDDEVVLNLGEVDVKLSVGGSDSSKSGKQKTKTRRHRSPNWSQVCTDVSQLVGLNHTCSVGFTIDGFLLWETGLAFILLLLYAIGAATMPYSERHCAFCLGITVNSISLLVFFIASTFAILDLSSKCPCADVMKGLKFVVHSVILLLQVSCLVVEFTEPEGSANQVFAIVFTLVECLVVCGNVCVSKKEYAIASQKRLLAGNRGRKKPKRGVDRKYYKRLHHSSFY